MRISVQPHITCRSLCTEKSVRTRSHVDELASKVTLLENGFLKKFRGLKHILLFCLAQHATETFTPPLQDVMQTLHQIGFFSGEGDFDETHGQFLQLTFPKEKSFLQHQGYCTSIQCLSASQQALVSLRNGCRLLLFSKGMRPPTCSSWLGFAVSATDRSLLPVSGASNEKLIASAH